jgi:hypothetical protein
MSLSALQQRFAQDAALLIQQARVMGYEVTFGEGWRSPHEAAWDASQGIGILQSLHTQRLAIDLNFFKDGQYIADGSLLADIGAWWKSLSPDHYWGGEFHDGNHFSLSPDGGKTR